MSSAESPKKEPLCGAEKMLKNMADQRMLEIGRITYLGGNIST